MRTTSAGHAALGRTSAGGMAWQPPPVARIEVSIGWAERAGRIAARGRRPPAMAMASKARPISVSVTDKIDAPNEAQRTADIGIGHPTSDIGHRVPGIAPRLHPA